MATQPFQFQWQRAKVILVWPGDDRIQPCYGGFHVMVPARHESAAPESKDDPRTKGSPFRFPSAIGKDGKPIPGTVLVENQLVQTPTGGWRPEFDVKDWIEGLMSVGREMFARGLTIVESVDEIEPAMRAGRVKWEAKQEEHWHRVLTAEHERREGFKRAGKRVPPAQNEAAIQAAIRGLQQLEQSRSTPLVSDDDIAAALKLTTPPSPRALSAVEAPPAPKVDEALDVAEALLGMCHEHNVRLTNAETMGLFRKDKAAIAAVEKKLAAATVREPVGV